MSTKQDLVEQLTQERYALSSLLEFVRTLTPDLGPRAIIRSVLRTVMGKSLIKDAFAYLSGDYDTFELVSRSGFAGRDLPQHLDPASLSALLASAEPGVTHVPLRSADGTGYLGMLGIGRSINPKLSGESEATYLASLAALTSIALTNAWLFEREKERERLESELRLARDIQLSLLPQRIPQAKGVRFAAVSRPSEWVGGDYYDLLPLDDETVLICVADVVGKGVAAALTMSNLQAALRALIGVIRAGHLDLLGAVREMNRLMCESTAPDRFITAAFGILNTRRRTLESVICGHPNPHYVAPDGTVSVIESTGIPLGIIPTFPYELSRHQLPEGALLLYYTDGLSEAKYGQGMVGAEGIDEVLHHPAMRSEDLRATLQRLVDSPNIEVEDDITILAVRFGEPG